MELGDMGFRNMLPSLEILSSLYLKDHPDNKYVLLFIKVAILKQKSKFEYGYKFNGDRMARQHIMLPATEDGRPDYGYMERKMRAVEARQLAQYISLKLANPD